MATHRAAEDRWDASGGPWPEVGVDETTGIVSGLSPLADLALELGIYESLLERKMTPRPTMADDLPGELAKQAPTAPPGSWQRGAVMFESGRPMDPDGMVHLVDHLEAQGRPTTPALRLVHAGRLQAWELPGRSGWLVDPVALEAALAGPDAQDVPRR